jgi:GMP synthase-like glutamine amidotransferase
MSDLLIVQNISREGPGLLSGVLHEHNITYDTVDLDKGETFPSPLGYKAIVVLGGPDSANDTSDKMTNELQQVTAAIDAGIPYLGICLGLQVLVKAADGRVVPGSHKEIGFTNTSGQPYAVEPTDAGKHDPLLANMLGSLPVFQLHGEVVELTDTMQLLATAPDCPNQIVKVAPKAYGIQSHFELTDHMLQVWASEDPDLTPIGYDALQKDFAAIKAAYFDIGETFFHNFLRIAGLIK